VRAVLPFFATAVLVAASLGAWSLDDRKSNHARTLLATDLSWVDHAGVGPVAFVETAGDPMWSAFQQLYWNGSIDRVYTLAGGLPIDDLPTQRVRVLDNGTMLVDGKRPDRALLIASWGTVTHLRGATRIGAEARYSLWRPDGATRMASLVEGLYQDKWLAAYGHATFWPDRGARVTGTLRLVVWAPPGTWTSPLHLTAPGVGQDVTVEPGERCVITVPVSARGPWTMIFESKHPIVTAEGRFISVQADEPQLLRAGLPAGATCSRLARAATSSA
jgi:hypothetical protein